MLGNMFFGWNCLAPWFSYPRRTALRRKFNLEVSPYSFFYFNMLFILLMPYWMESLCFILVHCLALFFLGSCSCGSSTLSFLFCFCVVCINQKWHSLVVFCCDMLFMKIEIICFLFLQFHNEIMNMIPEWSSEECKILYFMRQQSSRSCLILEWRNRFQNSSLKKSAYNYSLYMRSLFRNLLRLGVLMHFTGSTMSPFSTII